MSAPEQVTFLLACIRHIDDGKIDFDAVATELNIASKAAAAKRFERLKKRNQAGDDGEPITPAATPRKSRAKNASNTPATPGTPGTPTSAKRKRNGFTAVNSPENNDEEEAPQDADAVVETPTKVAKTAKMSTPRTKRPQAKKAGKEAVGEHKADVDKNTEMKQDSDEEVAVIKKEFKNTSINAVEI